MAYPPAYTRTFSFTDYEVNFPGEPKPGDSLDTEYDNVSNALTATQNALALIQRADGQLANDSVGVDQLQTGLFDGIADGITDDAEAAADAAAASASAAATSASQAQTSATNAAASAGTASGAAAQAGVSQGIAQSSANDASLHASNAFDSAQIAANAGNEAQGFRNEAEGFQELAFDWAEQLEGPVMPAPPGWPEAVDDGMFSSKWWAIRARDYNSTSTIDLGPGGEPDIGDAFDIWDAIPGNDLDVGQTYATWGTPTQTYVLIDRSDPSNPDSWLNITGGPGPPNVLSIGTVTTGAPGTAADVTITGTSPAQVLSFTIPRGDVGATGPQGPQGIQGIPGTGLDPTLDQNITGEWTFDPTVWIGHTPTEVTQVKANGFLYINDANEAAHVKGRLRIDRSPGVPSLLAQRVAGAFNAPTPMLAGDAMLQLSVRGSSDTGGSIGEAVLLSGEAAANWSASSTPGLFRVQVVPPGSLTLLSVAGFRGDRVENYLPSFHGFTSADIATIVASPVQAFDPTDGAHVNTRFHVERQNSGAPIYMRRWNGAYGAPTPILTGEGLGAVHYAGTTGTGPAQTGASLQGIAFDNWTSTSAPAYLAIYTTPVGGVTLLEVARFHNTSIRFNSPLLEVSGTVGAPAYSFTSDTDTGMYLAAPGVIDFATGGVIALRIAATGVFPFGNIYNVGGTAALPAYSFDGDQDTGMYRLTADRLGFATGGAVHFSIGLAAGVNVISADIPYWNTDGTASAPAYSFASDQDTGIYRAGANDMRLVSGGVARFIVTDGGNYARVTVGLADGSATVPGLSFENDPDTGLYRWGTDAFAATSGGSPVMSWRLGQSRINNGTTTAPALTFENDTDCGFYLNGTNDWRAVSGGAVMGGWLGPSTGTFWYMSDGSAASPHFAYLNDTDTGLYRENANVLGITTGGLKKALVGAATSVLQLYCDDSQGSGYLSFVEPAGNVRKCYIGYGDGNTDHLYFMNEKAGASVIIGTVGATRFQIDSTGVAYFGSQVQAVSFLTTSARASKRETGAPRRAAGILSRLRPILYRLLDGDDREQLGLIAEEVHDVCPQLSDGKTVAYDRLALLLLAAWQEDRVAA
jgi:hypothetical protein